MRARLFPALSRPFARFNTIIMHYHYRLSEVAFKPRSLAHVLQYTDFFTYNHCWAILTDGKQLRYRLTDANFF